MQKTYEEKILPQLYQEQGCHFLNKYKKTDYARVWVKSLRKQKSAHYVVYTVLVGEVPKDLFVLHRCNNKGCVNPAHLYLGDNQQNQLDASRDGLQAVGPSGRRGVSSTFRYGKLVYKAVTSGRPRKCLYYGTSLEEAIQARTAWELQTNF